jgi:hypothetical protein
LMAVSSPPEKVINATLSLTTQKLYLVTLIPHTELKAELN